MRCPECGTELQDVPEACPACGATLGEKAGAARPTGPEAGDGKRAPVTGIGAILLAAGALVVTGVTLALAAGGGRPHDPETYATRNIEIAAGISLAHANLFAWALLPAIAAIIVTTIILAQRGWRLDIRRIPGLDAIDEAVGRATEMGKPILFSVGLGGIDITTLQALAIAGHVARTAVKYATRLIIPVCDQQLMPITEEVMREAYASEGRPEAFRAEDVRFLSDRQFAYAAGVTGIMHREQPAATFLFGQFYAEALILAENGQAVGAIQVAGTPDLLQTPFFVAACDYALIGDEYYAATAYISREPTLLGSLTGQDIVKGLLVLLVVIGMVIASVLPPEQNPLIQLLGG